MPTNAILVIFESVRAAPFCIHCPRMELFCHVWCKRDGRLAHFSLERSWDFVFLGPLTLHCQATYDSRSLIELCAECLGVVL